VTRFLTQAARVLRSGGHLLFADVGPKPYIDTLRGHIAQYGLSIEEEEDITHAVSCALGITSEQNRKKIQEQVPVAGLGHSLGRAERNFESEYGEWSP
jgi:hypothetical protein